MITLGWDLPWIYLSKESCIHIFEEHPCLQEFELLLLPHAITRGMLIRERDRQNCVVAIYQHVGKRYIAAMKRSRSREIWVTTFHRARYKQTKALLKKGQIVRPHK